MLPHKDLLKNMKLEDIFGEFVSNSLLFLPQTLQNVAPQTPTNIISRIVLCLRNNFSPPWIAVTQLNWTVCSIAPFIRKKTPPGLWPMMEEGIHSALCAPETPIKVGWCSGLVTGEVVLVFMKLLLNLFSDAFEGVIEWRMGTLCWKVFAPLVVMTPTGWLHNRATDIIGWMFSLAFKCDCESIQL